MALDSYHYISRWKVEATVEEVAEIVTDALSFVDWWPSVYLEMKEVAPGDGGGVGREVIALTKGWLPYRLRFDFTVTESDYPRGYAVRASGDFEGRGIWTFDRDRGDVIVTYDWLVRPASGFLRRLAPVLMPVFSANHRWAMDRGEESLRLELARRRARTPQERVEIPQPPGPTFFRPAARL